MLGCGGKRRTMVKVQSMPIDLRGDAHVQYTLIDLQRFS